MAGQIKSLEEQIDELRTGLENALEVIDEEKKKAVTFRAATCTAAWALAMPATPGPNITGFIELQDGRRHCHEMLTPDAIEALIALAALDDSGYAPSEKRVRYTASDPPLPPEWPATLEGYVDEWGQMHCASNQTGPSLAHVHGPDCNEATCGCFAEGWRQRGEPHVPA